MRRHELSELGLGTLAACSVLIAALLVATPALGYGLCRINQPIRVTYPGASRGGSIPRNAALLVVVDGTVDAVDLSWSDGHAQAAEKGLGRFLQDARGRLTPGTHELTLRLYASSAARPLDPDTFTVRFDVADVVAPAPDETSRAAITRVFRFARWGGGILRDDMSAIDAALADPTDCSAEVAAQGAWCREVPSAPERAGELRVELEGEGATLGYAINDRFFLPAYCRSAFFHDGDAPFSVRPITETGAGSVQEYLGEVETEISADADPARFWQQTDTGACSIGTPGGATSRPVGLWVALLASTLPARRALSEPRRGAGRLTRHRTAPSIQ